MDSMYLIGTGPPTFSFSSCVSFGELSRTFSTAFPF